MITSWIDASPLNFELHAGIGPQLWCPRLVNGLIVDLRFED